VRSLHHPLLLAGYEGRCTLPSNFDATYTYSLGHAAAALLAAGKTGLMATVSCLERAPRQRVGRGRHPAPVHDAH
jgi:6-phosphofructokinase